MTQTIYFLKTSYFIKNLVLTRKSKLSNFLLYKEFSIIKQTEWIYKNW